MDARERDENAPHFIYCRQIKDSDERFKVYYTFKTDPKNVTKLTRVSIYDLLTEFFYYYSEKGEHWKKDYENQIITVDGSKNKKFDEEYMFTIKDPFDLKHNPGRVKKGEWNMVVQEFTFAYKCLSQKDLTVIESLFC